MKKISFLLIFLLFGGIFGFSQTRRTEYYFKFRIENFNDIRKISRIISIDNLRNDTIWAYANPKELEKFKLLGYSLQILPHPNTKPKIIQMATTVAQMANWDKYPTYDVYVQMMNQFAANYPDICTVQSIGTSVQGRQMLFVKISDNVNVQESEPEFMYSSTIHGDETTGFVLMLRLIDYLLNNYGTNPRITNLINNSEIWINPDFNPDGTYAGGNNSVSGATRSNANGDDLNRSFPQAPDPITSGYPIEVQNFINFTAQHSFVLAANFHGGTEVVNYPWDAWYKLHPDNTWYLNLSRAYADTVHAHSVSGYMTALENGVTNGAAWYIVEGGRQDFLNWYKYGREVTIEISDEKLLSTDQLDAHWNYNKNALLNFMEECLYGIKGIVTNTNGEPLDATITVISHDADHSETKTDPDVGDYHRMIAAGTYSLTFSSYGYISQSIPNVSVTNRNATILNVALEPAATVTVTGTVTEAISGIPLSNAKIQILDTPLPEVFSDNSGHFEIPNVLENTYNIRCSKENYTSVTQQVSITSTNHNVNFALNISTAISFENGTIPEGFMMTGNQPWQTDNSTAYDGIYSLKSGMIANSQTSVVSITKTSTQNGEISFYKKVSSEANYDYLKFYVDNILKEQWSGNVDWSISSFPISAGQHTYKWEYSKDNSTSSGQDAAWVDYIQFPPENNPTPILSINPKTIEKNIFAGNSDVANLVLANTGGGTISYSLNVENQAVNNWISLSQTSGTLNASQSNNIQVNFQVGKYDSTYQTKIFVTSNKKIDTVFVKIHCISQPVFTFSPTSITKIMKPNFLEVDTLKISNSGTGKIAYSLFIEHISGINWITSSVQNGELLANETENIAITFNSAAMQGGATYFAKILLTQNSHTDTILVLLSIKTTPKLQFSPQNFTKSLRPDTTIFDNLILKNIGDGKLTYSITFNETSISWLNISQRQGEMLENQSDTLKLTFNTNSLVDGNYNAEIRIQHNGLVLENQNVISVSLLVKSEPILTLSTDNLQKTLLPNSQDSDTIKISNTGIGNLSYKIEIENSVHKKWLSISQTQGNIPQGNQNSVRISYHSQNLSAGNYETRLIFTDNSTKKISYLPVKLTVKRNPKLEIRPTSISKTVYQGNSSTETVQFSNSGSGNIAYSLAVENASQNSWLTLSENSGNLTENQTRDISIMFTANLKVGFYITKIIVTDNLKKITEIPVNLIVLKKTEVEKFENIGEIECYPVPFSSENVLEFSLQKKTKLEISIFNSLGVKVKILINKELQPNNYVFEWNGTDSQHQNVQEGEYFYQIKTDSETKIVKVLKLR